MDQVPRSRQLVSLDAKEVIDTVANYFGVEPAAYAVRRSTAAGRDLAAYLAHRRTTSTLRELASSFARLFPFSRVAGGDIAIGEKGLLGSSF